MDNFNIYISIKKIKINKKDTNEEVVVGEEMPIPLIVSADNPLYEEQMPVYRNLGV